jgi:nucleotide-binding universal stress UspA family protein
MPAKKKQNSPDPSVLIAIDGSRPSSAAVEYAAHLTRLVPNMEFMLLNVMPQVPPILQTESKTDGQMRTRLKKLEAANRKKGGEMLEKAKLQLKEYGVPEERIRTKTSKRHSGLAKDIINEAELGKYDALIIGRRGLTRTQQVFMGSVSNQLIQHAANVPLWIVDGKVSKPKVLVAVDGSEASLRAVDHVAFVLANNPEAQVDFLHVTPKLQTFCAIDLGRASDQWDEAENDLEALEQEFLREDNVCLDDFMEKAIRILSKAGFSEKRIKILEREISMGIARTIVKAAKDGGYSTLVLGRRGMGKSSFLGSTSDRVIRRASNLAVWLVN